MHTLAFKPNVGWTTFYSYSPDWIQGLNMHLFTFKGGNLFRHNTNPVHNLFYGVEHESRIVVPFNDLPTKSKVFKAVSINGDAPWETKLNTDLTFDDDFIAFDGELAAAQYKDKEGEFYGYIRVNDNNVQMADQKVGHRTTIGLGIPTSVTVGSTPVQNVLNYNINTPISKSITVGDSVFKATQTGSELTDFVKVGDVVEVNVNKRFGINNIVVGGVGLSVNDYYVVSKKIPQESSGLVGHFMRVDLTLPYTGERKEIFTVRVETMRSFY